MDMEQQGQASSSTALWRWSPACAPCPRPAVTVSPRSPMIGDSVTAQQGHGGGYLATVRSMEAGPGAIIGSDRDQLRG